MLAAAAGGGSLDSRDRRKKMDFVELIVTISETIKDSRSRKWEVQVIRGELTVYDHGEIVSFATLSEPMGWSPPLNLQDQRTLVGSVRELNESDDEREIHAFFHEQ